MSNYKWSVFLSLMLLVSSRGYSGIIKEGDLQRHQLLSSLEQQSECLQSMQGTFLQYKHLSVLPAPIRSKGKFLFKKNSGAQWITESPVRNVLTIDYSGLSWNGDDNVTADQGIVKKASQFLAGLFIGILAGDFSELSKFFEIKTSQSSERWFLTLTPLDESIEKYLVRIEIEGQKYTELISIYEANGDRTSINLTVVEETLSNVKSCLQ